MTTWPGEVMVDNATMSEPSCDDAFHVTHQTVGPVNVMHNRYPAHHQLAEHEHDVAAIYLVLRGSHVEKTAASSS